MAKIGIDARIWRRETGGLSRYIRNLVFELSGLDRKNEYVVILTPEDEAEYSLSAPNFRSLVAPIPHYSYAEQLELLVLINKENFDLVHFSHFNHPILYRRPFVVTIHDLIMHLYPGGAQTKSLIRRLAYRWVVKDAQRAKQIIVPSLATKRDLESMLNFNPQKIIVTAEGSEESFRLHSAAEVAAIRHRFQLPEKYLLFVSRWEHYKGLPRLLEAYNIIRKYWPDIGLVVCGKPDPIHPEVEALVRTAQTNNPLIITPGFVSDTELAALYAAASVYVHPSWYEGFGIMVLEAFASGVPVVTSNVSSLPEVAGQAALLVDPHNPNDIAEKVGQILANPKLAEQLTARGLLRVKDFSWSKMAAETLAVYRKVLGS